MTESESEINDSSNEANRQVSQRRPHTPYLRQLTPPNTSPQPASPLVDYTLRTQPGDARHGGSPSQRGHPHLHSTSPQQSQLPFRKLMKKPTKRRKRM